LVDFVRVYWEKYFWDLIGIIIYIMIDTSAYIL